MRKGVIVIAAIVFLFVPLVAAADVAYIYRANFRVDPIIVEALNNLNLSVQLINERNLPTNWSQYKIIFVGDERFRNDDRIPVNDFPSVIVNYYHTEDWGLTDRDGASQLASNRPLSVLHNNRLVQVYTIASGPGGTSLPYYYLDNENRARNLQTIAGTEPTPSGASLGSVISYADAGVRLENGITQRAKLCYFGLVESGVWTTAARNMFNDCVGFVVAEEIVPACFDDSDCGADGFVSDPFCTDVNVTRVFQDFRCNNPGTVEASCSSVNTTLNIETCSESCSAGSCVDIECFTDAECNDFNPLTFDQCINNGTVVSECRNTPVNCAMDSDCGFTGFLGEEFCSPEDNVGKNFQNATCLNPGMLDSACRIVVGPVEIQECQFACFSGACVRCDEDLDCNDDDGNTIDTCLNPDTLESFCQNTPQIIICSNDLDCGVDGFIDAPVCTNGDVTRTFREFDCHNPGLPSSFCTNSTSTTTVQECEFSCESGACVDDRVHDISFVDFNGAVNNILLEDENGETVLSNELECNRRYLVEVGVENRGDFIEDVSFVGSIGNVNFNHNPSNDMNPGAVSFRSLQVNFSLDEGFYNVSVEAEISGVDETPSNNFARRQVLVSCDEPEVRCFNNLDCGVDGFVGEEFCTVNNLSRIFVRNICNNAGQTNSFCTIANETRVVEECSFGCEQGMCLGEEIHDVGLVDFSGSVDRIRLEYVNGTDILNDELTCNERYKVSVTLENFGTGSEDVSFDSSVGGIDFAHAEVQDFEAGGSRFRTRIVNFSLVEGFYDITVRAIIDGFADRNSADNVATRNVFVMCEEGDVECFNDSDCGIDGFMSDPFCSENHMNVLREFRNFTCLNPGTTSSDCVLTTANLTLEICEDICVNGVCEAFVCDSNSDCGTIQESAPFCGAGINRNIVYINETLPVCEWPGMPNAQCVFPVQQRVVIECAFACSSGACVRCDENLDCNDNNSNTNDLCIYPGTAQSFCQNNPTVPPTTQCSDGIDNDGDNLIDYPADPGCSSRADDSESPFNGIPQCSDGIDNDGDGRIDYPADGGCTNRADNSE